MNIIEEIKTDANALSLLKDWLGDKGEPVRRAWAESRASVCVIGNGGYRCLMNKEPGWWDRVKNAIAMTIRRQIELKRRMNLHLSCEVELGICTACGCCLPLACWVPVERLAEHTTQDQLNKMPGFCWKKNEVITYNKQKGTH